MILLAVEPPSFPVLIERDAILRRIGELAAQVAARHRAPADLCVVAVIDGARAFCAELVHALPTAPVVHEIRARSYGERTASAGRVELSAGTPIDCDGRMVLIVEDIVDTGRTVACLGEHFRAQGAAGVEVATLLTKPARREVEVALDYVGFEVDDRFVIGFGMDFAGRYRDLPHVAVYDPEIERRHGR